MTQHQNQNDQQPQHQQTKGIEAALDEQLDLSLLAGNNSGLYEREDKVHFRFLRNMRGAFLTRLDLDSKIIGFFGGAIRCRIDDERDEVIVVTPMDIAERVANHDGNPVPRVITITGEDRFKDYRIDFKSVPFLEALLSSYLTEGAAWGIMSVYPAPDKQRVGDRINGRNAEEYLLPRTWRPADAGAVAGSGGYDFSERLSPRALEVAQKFPSAWWLAAAGIQLFGGMTNVPQVKNLELPATVRNLVAGELERRKRFALESQIRRERARAEERARRFVDGRAPLMTGLDEVLDSAMGKEA